VKGTFSLKGTTFVFLALVKYFFVHKIVLKAILVFQYTLDYLATFVVNKMASFVLGIEQC
jgi:hypothetical protein